MRKIVCVVVILAFSSNLFAGDKLKSQEFERGYLDGKDSADEEYKGDGWFGAGLAGGILLGLIGMGVVAGVSQIGSAESMAYREDYVSSEADYRLGFQNGYTKQVKSTRLKKSLIGGAVGTAIIVTLFLATQESD